jgi:hypothetical protein
MDFLLSLIQSFGNVIKAIWTAVPFSSATWVVIAVLGFFVWLFKKAHNDPNSPIEWEHLIISTETNRADPYKLGYLVGLIVATWIVVRFMDAGTLNWDIFGGYLLYLLGGAGVNSWKSAKENTASIAATGVRVTPPPAPRVDDVVK